MSGNHSPYRKSQQSTRVFLTQIRRLCRNTKRTARIQSTRANAKCEMRNSVSIDLYTMVNRGYTHILLLKRHHLLDLGNRLSGVKTLRARPGAVQDGVATVHTHAIVQCGLSFFGLLVT